MRTVCFIILAVLSLSQHACAQWSVGAEAGFVRNSIPTGTAYDGNYHHNGFKFGGVVEYTLKNHVSFESGVSYLRRGGEVRGHDMNYMKLDRIEFLNVDYLQFPLTIGYKFTIGKDLSFKPHLGYYYAWGIRGDALVSDNDASYSERVSIFGDNISSAPYRPCNRHDIGLSFGVNVNYKNFTVKFAYDRAFSNVTHYGDGKNRTFCASLIYWIKFPLPRHRNASATLTPSSSADRH